MYMRCAVHGALVGGVFLLQAALVAVLALDAGFRRDAHLALVLGALAPYALYSLGTLSARAFTPSNAARGAAHTAALAYGLGLPAALLGAGAYLCLTPEDAHDTAATPARLARAALADAGQRAASLTGLYLLTGAPRLVYGCCFQARMLTDDRALAAEAAEAASEGGDAAQAGAARRRRWPGQRRRLPVETISDEDDDDANIIEMAIQEHTPSLYASARGVKRI